MKLSKNQIILIALGGGTAVAVLALGYLLFGAYSAGTEAADEFEGTVSSVRQLVSGKIAPTSASLREIASNETAMVEWREAMLAALAEGDVTVNADTDEATFKQQMVDEARVLAKLPGGRAGALVANDFAFGFKEYIGGGDLPAKEALPKLQRQWHDIKILVNQLSACGVTELVKIDPQQQPAAPAPVTPVKKAGAKKQKNVEKPAYTRESYALEFHAMPAALVKVVNALTVLPRFTVIDSFEFFRPTDMIATALAGDEQKAGAAAQPRRRRRRAAAEGEATAEEAAPEATLRKGIVNDPSLEAPFTVRLVVSTYDFGTKEVAE